MNPDETLDEFYRGKVRLFQPRKGYRFALDAPLLADFIETRLEDEICELGTGNGVIAVLLSLKPFRRIVALELQASLFDLAVRNIALNGLAGRVEVAQADLREYRPGRVFDLVFSNPPYVRKGTGFPSPQAEKTVAKQEITCDIYEVMRAVSDLLKPLGRACFVFPASRFDDLADAARGRGLHPRRLRFVHPRAGDPANLFLSEFRFGPAEVPLTMEPLVLYGPDGEQTPETLTVCEGRTRGPARP
ncbi:MAG: methyltransferase [Candidatus Aminicenantes bacterium]|nr:methyltransferase [Candidatus Aminicenantes bacterium]